MIPVIIPPELDIPIVDLIWPESDEDSDNNDRYDDLDDTDGDDE